MLLAAFALRVDREVVPAAVGEGGKDPGLSADDLRADRDFVPGRGSGARLRRWRPLARRQGGGHPALRRDLQDHHGAVLKGDAPAQASADAAPGDALAITLRDGDVAVTVDGDDATAKQKSTARTKRKAKIDGQESLF